MDSVNSAIIYQKEITPKYYQSLDY